MDELLQPNSLVRYWDRIPQVIRDSIDFSDSLGEQYLRVDSLCIVQDDSTSKHHQLAIVGEIYNSAIATLFVCTGANASFPLLAGCPTIDDLVKESLVNDDTVHDGRTNHEKSIDLREEYKKQKKYVENLK